MKFYYQEELQRIADKIHDDIDRELFWKFCREYQEKAMAEMSDEEALRIADESLGPTLAWGITTPVLRRLRDALAEKVERARAEKPKRPSLKELAAACSHAGDPKMRSLSNECLSMIGQSADILRALDEMAPRAAMAVCGGATSEQRLRVALEVLCIINGEKFVGALSD